VAWLDGDSRSADQVRALFREAGFAESPHEIAPPPHIPERGTMDGRPVRRGFAYVFSRSFEAGGNSRHGRKSAR